MFKSRPLKPPREKTLVRAEDQAQQRNRNGRFFAVVLVIQVSFFVVVFVIASVWQNNLDKEHSARSRTADCQFAYSVQLSKVLQARSAIGEKARLDGLSGAATNDLLNQHPYPKVPDCRR